MNLVQTSSSLRQDDLTMPTTKQSQSDEIAAYINDGSLISFVEGLSFTQKSDVLNSTLLAQCVATTFYDRVQSPTEWYQKYFQTLERIGWVGRPELATEYISPLSQVQLDQVMLETMKTSLSSKEYAVLLDSTNTIKSLGSGSATLELWNSSASNSQGGNFQIGCCTAPNGNVTMQLGAFFFLARQWNFNFFWYPYEASELRLGFATQTLILQETVYAQIRKAIIQKLGNKASNLIANLNL